MLPLMIVKSPRCDDLVTLPAGLTPETRVRCPYTKEEFLIQEILDGLPPMLEVIDGPPAATIPGVPAAEAVGPVSTPTDDAKPDAGEELLMAEDAGDAATAVSEDDGEVPAPVDDSMFDFLHGPSAAVEEKEEPAAAAKGPALFEPTDEEAGSAAGAFDVTGEAAPGGAASDVAPSSMKVRTRPKKKPKNAAIEMVKVILGGFGGLLIAQIILWWAVPTGCSANPDPIGLAPQLPGFLQWMAPERLRNPDAMPVDPVPPVEGTQQGNPPQDPQVATSPQTPEQLGMPFPATGQGNTTNDGNAGPDDNGESGSDGGQGDSDTGLSVDLPGIDDGDLTPGGIVEPGIDDPLEITPDAPSTNTLGVLNPPIYDGQQLGESHVAAKAQRDEMEKLGGLEGKDMRDIAGFYMPFCELAQRATYVNPKELEARAEIEEVEKTLQEFGKNNKNLDALGPVTEYYLNMTGPRKSEGILLAGVVRKIESRGKLFGTSVAIAGTQERVVMVLSRIDPKKKISDGDRVIILGAMVKDPSANLGGYEGSEKEVVWGGLPVKLPKIGPRRPTRPGGGAQNSS